MNESPSGTQRILIGVAGWSYADWEGLVYPKPRPRGFDPLKWLGRFIDLVEINVSFYRIPRPSTVLRWIERVEQGRLRFSAKLPSAVTHERAGFPDSAVDAYLDFRRPLLAAGRLEASLAQFPWSLRPTPDNLDRLQRLRDRFAEDAIRAGSDPAELVLELRHAAWSRPPVETWLREEGFQVAGIDQPALRDCRTPSDGLGRQAYLRLHGRNARAWFDRRAGRDERYDYRYSPEELAEWIERARRLAQRRERVRVVLNNHFQGQALVDALEIAHGLGRPVEEIPAGLWNRREDLRRRWAARSSPPPRPVGIEVLASAFANDDVGSPSAQGELFGDDA